MDEQQQAKQRLAALAERGSEARVEERAERSGGANEWRQQLKRRRAARRQRWQVQRSCSRLAELMGIWFKVGLVLPAIGAIVWLATVFEAAQPTGTPEQHLGFAALAGAGVWLAVICVAHLVGIAASKVAVAKEHRWADGLPFEVRGYFGSLGRKGNVRQVMVNGRNTVEVDPAVQTVTLRVEVADPTKSKEFIADLLRATVPKAKCVSHQPTRFEIRQQKMGCVRTCHRLRRWLHQVVDDLLMPLHEGHRVLGVTVEAKRH